MDLCIVGTGYVGLVTAACFAEMGNKVVCVDTNPAIIGSLQQGRVHIYEPGLESLVGRNAVEGRLQFSNDLAAGLENALYVFNCVGTPANSDGSCNLEDVKAAALEIGRLIAEYKIIITKSTVPVGTADAVRRILQEEIDARGLSIEFDVVSNPEFLQEGDAVNNFMKPDRIIVGTDNIRTAKLLETLYAPFARSRDKMLVMDIRSAEMTKYAANCMLAAKVSFINEIANICERVGADVGAVRLGIGSDHRIGHHFIYPGVGYGGSCFPKDVKALLETARENGYEPQLVAAVEAVNHRQKRVLADKILEYLQGRGGLEKRCVAMWGLAFKGNTDDIREASSLAVIGQLSAAGVSVRAYDPAAGANARRVLAGNPQVAVMDDQYLVLEGADALAVVTDWNQFRNPDFKRLRALLNAPVVFDGRNLYNPEVMAHLGFTYFSIGRPPAVQSSSG
jgi:UDPglucose 6-dehydrogenase